MAISVLPDREGKFLRAVGGKLDETSENLRWLTLEADKRGLIQLAMPWVAMYFNRNRDEWGYRMYAKSFEALGSYPDAGQVLFDGLLKYPTDKSLQQAAESFVRRHHGQAPALEQMLRTGGPP